MRVYVDPPKEMSKGIGRVAKALKAHLPEGVKLATCAEHADLVVFHVVGVQNFSDVDLPTQIGDCVGRGQRYAMIQYCIKTTENGGDPAFWMPLWDAASCVWSYYDLDEHVSPNAGPVMWERWFYYAPLGCDPEVFKRNPRQQKLFKIGTSGFVAETEGVLECAAACAATGNWQFHLGPDLRLGAHVAQQIGLTDLQVADRWRECEYVAGLRRVEGFELPAVEGLFCGSVPVLFEAPHYRKWFDGLGMFITERDADNVRLDLEALFSMPYEPLTDEQYQEARIRFDWSNLVTGFWERAL